MHRAQQFRRRIVIGTPVTPVRLLDQLAGASFCVSYAYPDQLTRVERLIGPDSILLLDNGAFTHWRAGRGAIDSDAFWQWANPILARCPVAVAVIPDVIEGDERANLSEVSRAIRSGLCQFPERACAVWHLDESTEQLHRFCRLLNFVALGSCAAYDVQRRRAAYLSRIIKASAVIDAVEHEHGRRPWIHLMRGVDVLPDLCRFESADSAGFAVNHRRYPELGDDRVRWMLDRADARVALALDGADLEPAAPCSNFDNAPTLRPGLPSRQRTLF